MIKRTLSGWLPVIEFCAEEVRRQYYYEDSVTKRNGPSAVGWMANAWWFALEHEGPITVDLIVRLGQAIEPTHNHNGIRRVDVWVGDRKCPDPQDVPRLLSNLVEHGIDLEPAVWYKEFEMIHPFRDGNGRTGKVLYNMLNGTLLAPEFPPNPWGQDIINP